MMLVALTAGLTLLPNVTVDAREVRVSDLVRNADGGQLAGSDASRIVLRLPAGHRQVTLLGPAVAALVRRAGFAVQENGTVTITRRDSVRVARGCWNSTRALAAGEVVTMRNAAPAVCGGAAATIIAADGQPTTRAFVPAGAPLGRLVPASLGRVASGAALTLRSVAGPVAIERNVTTVQSGRSGHRVFVRDGEGQVFAADLLLQEDAR